MPASVTRYAVGSQFNAALNPKFLTIICSTMHNVYIIWSINRGAGKENNALPQLISLAELCCSVKAEAYLLLHEKTDRKHF